MIVWANLDQEARWSGLGLPAHVVRRISAAGVLAAALAPGDEPVDVCTPGPVDMSRVHLARVRSVSPAALGPRPEVRGPRSLDDLVWCDPAAKAFNDRRFALALAAKLDCALPGAGALDDASAIESFAWPARWVAKAVWTAAGRDRARGDGAPTGELRNRIANLIARGGAVVVEPWLDRVVDVGVTAHVGRAPSPPHRLLVDDRGGVVGIDLAEPELPAGARDRLAEVADAAGRALADAGYTGPYTIDAFVHRDAGGGLALHPLCELNARYTFGHVARALGGRVLGFGPPPAGARVLVAPAADDAFTAWVA